MRSGDSFNLECNARGLWPVIQQTREDDWTVYWSYEPDVSARALGAKPLEKMWESQIFVPFIEGDKMFQAHKKSDSSEEKNAVPLTLFDTEQRRIDNVEYNMSGQFVCTVVSKAEGMSERRFITNSIHLTVIPPLTLKESIIEWLKDNQHSVTALFLTLILVIIAYVLLIKRRAKRIASTKNMDEADEFQANLAVVDAKHG
ncbi:unnamed protein product [Dibothriocephalus latus]|uniref:Ig-like domain-containing protein n=1 Tax=Dibothriocephalus latus TaxID=60516 RepID=A0A3P7NCL3_DIBLA|nr:unnamed protein product [Dibothriocephalus latus]